jgi:hypothetical protein
VSEPSAYRRLGQSVDAFSSCGDPRVPATTVSGGRAEADGEFLRTLKLAAIAAPLLSFSTGAVLADPLDDLFYPADSNGVLPIGRILDQARAAIAGTITEVELERENGRLVYGVEIVTPNSRARSRSTDPGSGRERGGPLSLGRG